MALTRRELKKHRAEVVQTTHDFSEATLRVDIASVGRYWRFANACTVTVPDDRTIVVDSEIRGRQGSAGEITFIAIDGVIINGVDGYNNATNLEGSVFKLKKVAAMEWDLEAVPSLAATVVADVTPPTITSASTTSVYENEMLAFALTADEPVVWSIVGSVDQAQFEISGATLRWISNGTKDFETPLDDDTDNDYLVTIRARDLAGNETDQVVTVTVMNVIEPGVGALIFTGSSPSMTFTIPPGAGTLTLIGNAPSANAWNPNDRDAGITLSGGDLIATNAASSAYRGVRGSRGHTSGKYVFEISLSGGDANSGIGIGNASASLAQYLGNEVAGYSFALYPSGQRWLRATQHLPNLFVWNTGNIPIMIAVDLTNKLVWFKKVGASWNNDVSADPATGTGGWDYSPSISGVAYPMFVANIASIAATLNTGASPFTNTAPSGFVNWNT